MLHSNNIIPDISYHLIFCFLSLRQLPLIAQCSKEYKRIVTELSFLNMFRHKYAMELFKIKNKQQIELLSKSPFHHAIRGIIMHDTYGNLLSNSIYFIQFYKLISLDIAIDWCEDRKQNFDIKPVFQALGPGLLKLKIIVFNNPYKSSPWNFQKALLFLTSLTSLELNKVFPTDCSFLSHMKQLRSFSCDFDLTHLYLNYSSPSDNSFVYQMRNVCTELENSKLKNIGSFKYFTNIPKKQESECLQLLNRFNQLETIDIKFVCNDKIPTFLGKWIQNLEFHQRTITDRDMSDMIINLPNLKSITLESCMIQPLQIKNLINGLCKRLEVLCINSENGFHVTYFQVPFDSLFTCTKLKSLKLALVYDLEMNKIDELFICCKQLKSVEIRYIEMNKLKEFTKFCN
jgi:hypothetical protein